MPPNVIANPASGFVAALGTYDTNGLTTTLDCAPAIRGAVGATVQEITQKEDVYPALRRFLSPDATAVKGVA